MSKARAEIEVTASSAKLASDLRAASSQFASWARNTARAADREFGKVGKNVGSGLGKGGVAIGNFAGNLITKGFDKLVDTAHDVQDFERDLVRLQITANQGPQWASNMRDAIRALSRETGVNSSEILKATANYVDLTGDVAGAQASMRTFARVAQASGASMSDVSTAAAALGDALHINPGDFESTFSGLITQGKAGAISLKDFAGELSSLAPKFARFGVTGRAGAIDLGAALQVARHGFGSASEAATGLESLMGALSKNAAKFEAVGVKVFDRLPDGTKQFRSLHEIVTAISNSKLAKDPTALSKAFGRKEAESTFNQLNRLKGMYDEMVTAGQDSGSVQRDLTTYLESSAGRIDASWNSVKETLASVFTPERIQAFAAALETVVGTVADALGKISDTWDRITGKQSDNPFEVTPEAPGPSVMDVYRSPLAAGKKFLENKSAEFAHEQAANAVDVTGKPIATKEQALQANRAAYAKAYADISGKGTRAERVKAAEQLVATNVTSNAPGAEGRFKAARAYESDYHVTAGEQKSAREANEKAMADALAPALSPVIAAVNALTTTIAKIPLPTVKIGDDQVAQSASKAKGARGGWGD